jgi:hypothetical protein
MLTRVLLLAAAAAAAAVLTAIPPGNATPAHAAAQSGGGGCTGYTGGGGWWVTCQNGGHPGGGGGGGGQQSSCFWSSDNQYFPAGFRKFAPPAPHGYIYLVQVCHHGQYLSLPVLAANGGALTPQALARQAYKELAPPLPDPHTAPPRGQDGLVGLPEWFWVPAAQWAPLTRRLAVGRVWAQVTATPRKLTFSPGAGLPAVSCPGPGTPYNPALPAGAQRSDCTYTFDQSSGGLPGNAYAGSVTITWTAAWTGSGGTGGTLPPLTRTTTFAVPVAEAQALYGTGR